MSRQCCIYKVIKPTFCCLSIDTHTYCMKPLTNTSFSCGIDLGHLPSLLGVYVWLLQCEVVYNTCGVSRLRLSKELERFMEQPLIQSHIVNGVLTVWQLYGSFKTGPIIAPLELRWTYCNCCSRVSSQGSQVPAGQQKKIHKQKSAPIGTEFCVQILFCAPDLILVDLP